MYKLTTVESIFLPLSLTIALSVTSLPAVCEIYKWVDANGKVHYSDKRSAQKNAQSMDEPKSQVTDDGFEFTFLPQADALLNNSTEQAQGKSRILSSGFGEGRSKPFAVKSLLQFEITELLQELNKSPIKRLDIATLELHANTTDNMYGQGSINRESPGHSTADGDNAFYLKPVHNNWSEADVTWSSFYSPSNYTPLNIRKLPSILVPGSGGIPGKNYNIDVTELVASLILQQQREFTLEMSPQRKSRKAQVTFYSRESDPDKAPKLLIKLK